jgi:transposase
VGRPSKFPAEFRREAIELVRSSGRPRVEVARSIGISDNPLANWARANQTRRERDADPDALTESERAELRRLRATHSKTQRAVVALSSDGGSGAEQRVGESGDLERSLNDRLRSVDDELSTSIPYPRGGVEKGCHPGGVDERDRRQVDGHRFLREVLEHILEFGRGCEVDLAGHRDGPRAIGSADVEGKVSGHDALRFALAPGTWRSRVAGSRRPETGVAPRRNW